MEVLLSLAQRHLTDAKSGHVDRFWLRATIENLSLFMDTEGDAVDLYTREKLASALQQLNSSYMADVVEASLKRLDEFGRPLPDRCASTDPQVNVGEYVIEDGSTIGERTPAAEEPH